MKQILSFVFVIWLLALTGCGSPADLDASGVPHKLIISMYGGDNADKIKAAIEPLRLYLQKKLGIGVQYIFTTDYTSAITGLRTKKIHMASLTPYTYIIATQKTGLLPLVSIGENGKPSVYHSVIFTNHKTGIKTINDLKAHAKHLTISFANPASASGHLIPREYLKSIGLNPDNAFKATIFAANHTASIFNVKSGIADIGCSTNDLPQDKLIRAGANKNEDLIILWVSPPIMNDVMTVRSDLNKDFIKKVRNAYLDVAKEDFAALEAYAKLYHSDPQAISYVAVQDSMYNSLRNKANSLVELRLEK
jgi:phosphonate transport system substrate-binding protein